MLTRRIARALALAAALGGGALATGMTGAAAETSALDQYQLDDSDGYAYVCDTGSLAQTFTAGVSGALDRVALRLIWNGVDPGPLTVTIETVDDRGIPTGVVLGSGSTTAMDAGLPPNQRAWVEISLSRAASVTAGTQYALVLKADAAPDCAFNRWGWYKSQLGDPYPGGAAMGISTWSGWSALGSDFAFETYVLPGVAPGGGNSASARLCRQNGWQNLVTSTGESFSNTGACVSYAGRGGTLRPME